MNAAKKTATDAVAEKTAAITAKAEEAQAQVDAAKLTLLGWLEHGTAFTLYDDDGESANIDLAEGLTLIDVQIKEGKVVAKAAGLVLDTSRIIVG